MRVLFHFTSNSIILSISFQDNCSIVNLSQIKNIYHKYHDIMSKHAEKIQSNYKFKTASELFSQNWSDLDDLHVSW